MAELRIALNSTTPSGVGNNEIVLYPTNNNGGELNVVGPDGQPKRLLTDLTTLNNITVSGSLTKTGTATIPNIGLPVASATNDGAMSRFDKQLLDGATEDNTDNALVRRDNTGSFEASTITANLFEGPSTSTQLIPNLTGAVTSDGSSNNTVLSTDLIDNTHIKSNAGISLSKLATDPLARTGHTGTQPYTTISDFNEGVDNYLTTNKITTEDISSTAAITMSQLALDPTNRTNHVGPNPASDLEGLDTEVNTIIETFLLNNPIENVQISNGTIDVSKLNFNPLDRTSHTGNMPASNLIGLEDEVLPLFSGLEAILYDNTTGEFSLQIDSTSLKYTSSGVGISDTYVASVSNGGTGKTTKAEASHNLTDINTVNSNTTLDATTQHVLVVTSSGNVDITLPAASGTIVKYYIKKKSVDNVLNILVDGTDTIEGQSSLALNNQYDYVVLQNDGTDLWVLWSSVIN